MSDNVENDCVENDQEMNQIFQLRCSSIQTEILSERQKQKNQKTAYPGLAFGSSIFFSHTLMKFNIIANELHNIQNVQLKRVWNLKW